MRRFAIVSIFILIFALAVGCSTDDIETGLHGDTSRVDPHGVLENDKEDLSDMSLITTKKEFAAQMITNGAIEEVFPLFCPQREHDWIPSWQTDILWSESGLAEEGAVFKTGNETWIITDYEPMKMIYFVRYNQNVVTRLKIDVIEEDGKTTSVWTQSETATSPEGNGLIESSTQEKFTGMIKGLEIMLNHYVESGIMVDEETASKILSHTSH